MNNAEINNYFNLDFIAKNPFNGQTGQRGRFGIYDTKRNGLRAGAKNQIGLQIHHGLRTPSEMIRATAPPNENDTAGYIAWMCDWCGVSSGQTISLLDPALLEKWCRRMVWREQGEEIYSTVTDGDWQQMVDDALEGVPASFFNVGGNIMGPKFGPATQPQQVTQPEAGIKSSEHLWTGIGAAFPIIMSMTGNLPPATAAKVSAAIIGIYVIARTALKMAHVFGLAKNIPDLPDVGQEVPKV